MIRAWLVAFVFCQLIEVPIYSLALSCSPIIAFGASAITHPLMWFGIFGPHWHADYLTKAIVGEMFAWLGEAAYFGLIFKRRRALVWAFWANLASMTLALLSRYLFGAP